MTTTEDQVRAGLTGLAPSAPADDAAFAGVGRAITRRRRRRTGAQIAAVAALALVVVGGAALLTDGDEAPVYTDGIGPSTTTPTTASSTSESTAPDASGRVPFGDVEFELPAGWSVVWEVENQMCVSPAGTADDVDCAGVILSVGHQVVGHEGGPYVDHGDWSWYQGTDVMRCPSGSSTPNGEFDGVIAGDAGMAPVERDNRPVGDRTAVYDRWEAVCDISGFEFSPQAWHLSEPEMLIVDLIGRPETESMLASFEFTDDSTGTGG